MEKIIKISGRKYRVNVEQFAEFISMILAGIMVIAAFVFFFGFCWGGFLR